MIVLSHQSNCRLLLYLLTLQANIATSTWKTFRQNRQRTGGRSIPVAPATATKFEYKTGNYVTSSAALSGNGKILYIGSLDSYLHAVDTTTGKRIWRYKTGANIHSSPCIHPSGNTIYIGSNDHYLHAVDASTGKKKWMYETGNWVYSSPTVSSDGKTVFVGS
jgi:outer membrane protein assembly factor BamB